jgi:hypothetical protein
MRICMTKHAFVEVRRARRGMWFAVRSIFNVPPRSHSGSTMHHSASDNVDRWHDGIRPTLVIPVRRSCRSRRLLKRRNASSVANLCKFRPLLDCTPSQTYGQHWLISRASRRCRVLVQNPFMYRYQRHGLGIMRSFSGLHGYVAVATVLPLLRLPPTFHGFRKRH